MENPDVAAVFDDLADLLEIKGANPFRVRAYRNGARTIRGLTRPLRSMIEEGEDLTELPGIGKDLAQYAQTLVETGELPILDEVKAEVPEGLVDLVKLDGVGPKKAKKLWEELDITSVDELEEAIEAGEVEELSGFGKKSVEKIEQAIEDFRKHQGRFLISRADQSVEALLEHLRSGPGIERLEVAGSYRRRKETVGDLDILAEIADGGDESAGLDLMEHFTSYPSVDRVDMSGATRGSVTLVSGLQVDLRIIPRSSWGAALLYFTGSKEHNVVLRQRAQKRSMRLNEWGLFRVPDEVDPEGVGVEEMRAEWDRAAGADEEEIYEALDLVWIDPVLRENRGEFEAAESEDLPDLIERADLKGDLHMHSTWTDGKKSIREMAEGCRERGYDYLVITDHSQAVTVANGLTPERIREQWVEIDEVRAEFDDLRIFRGCEVDILKDGSLDLPDDVLEDLDFVIVSVHSYMDLDRSAMTDRIIRALENPNVDLLAHPTGRLINRREPYAVDIDAVLEACAEHQVAVELNANPNRLDLNDDHLRRAKELGLKVAIDTDAHSDRELDLIEYGIGQARRGWIEKDDVLNALTLEQFEGWLGRRGAVS